MEYLFRFQCRRFCASLGYGHANMSRPYRTIKKVKVGSTTKGVSRLKLIEKIGYRIPASHTTFYAGTEASVGIQAGEIRHKEKEIWILWAATTENQWRPVPMGVDWKYETGPLPSDFIKRHWDCYRCP